MAQTTKRICPLLMHDGIVDLYASYPDGILCEEINCMLWDRGYDKCGLITSNGRENMRVKIMEGE